MHTLYSYVPKFCTIWSLHISEFTNSSFYEQNFQYPLAFAVMPFHYVLLKYYMGPLPPKR
jgi:hypothetical protein